MKLHEKLSLIQSEFKAKKSRFNNFGKYNFRSAEDILEALKPYNQQHGVYFTVSEKIVLADTEFPIMESIATISDGTDAIHRPQQYSLQHKNKYGDIETLSGNAKQIITYILNQQL